MKQKSVLLVGCGELGLMLGAELMSAGFEVTGLRRHPPQDVPFPILQGDLLKSESLEMLAPSYDFVVYTPTPSEITPEGYQAIYVDALRNLLAVIAQPAECLLLVSSTGVYGQSQGEWVDELSDTSPPRFSGQCLLEGERLAQQAWPNTTVVRFSGIYGPGRLRMVRKVQGGEPIIESPPQYTNRFHRDDCVGLLLYLIQQQLAGVDLDAVYIGTDDDPAPASDVLDFIADELGIKRLPRKAPEAAVNMSQNKRCSNQRIKALGYHLKYPSFKEGYLQVLAGLRALG